MDEIQQNILMFFYKFENPKIIKSSPNKRNNFIYKESLKLVFHLNYYYVCSSTIDTNDIKK